MGWTPLRKGSQTSFGLGKSYLQWGIWGLEGTKGAVKQQLCCGYSGLSSCLTVPGNGAVILCHSESWESWLALHNPPPPFLKMLLSLFFFWTDVYLLLVKKATNRRVALTPNPVHHHLCKHFWNKFPVLSTWSWIDFTWGVEPGDTQSSPLLSSHFALCKSRCSQNLSLSLDWCVPGSWIQRRFIALCEVNFVAEHEVELPLLHLLQVWTDDCLEDPSWWRRDHHTCPGPAAQSTRAR